MSKPVRLTRIFKGVEYVEECLLMEEGDKFIVEGVELVETDLHAIFAANNWVMFEGEEGIFGIDPNQIVSIDML